MLLMIDNYDSFTYNLVQYLKELGTEVEVVRNDQITCKDIETLNPEHIIISPGPGRPEEAGITLELIKQFSGMIPILGVCLGHQAIAQAFGASIIHANQVMHGKASQIHHHQEGVFHGMASPFEAIRYHSLVINPETLPPEFAITAWTQDHQGKRHEIMGIKHCNLLVEGVQFHPESILTESGHQLLSNFLNAGTTHLMREHYG